MEKLPVPHLLSSTGIVAPRSTTAQGLCLRADRAVVPTFSDDPLYLLA